MGGGKRKSGEPWFVGKDVAVALGYSVARKAIRDHVDEEDKQILTFQNGTFESLDIPNRGLTIINESGLYSLVLSSKLPQAKVFKRWVTAEVLPSIRRHGAYAAAPTLGGRASPSTLTV
jgi:anti-repressor protein